MWCALYHHALDEQVWPKAHIFPYKLSHWSILEWQVFRFLKGQNPQFSRIVIFTIFWDLTQRFLINTTSEKCRNQQGRLIYTTFTDKLWSFLSSFQSNLTSLRFLKMIFTVKYSKNNDFLWYFFWVAKMPFSVIFRIFHFVFNVRDFYVFSVSRKTCHSSLYHIDELFSVHCKLKLPTKSVLILLDTCRTYYRMDSFVHILGSRNPTKYSFGHQNVRNNVKKWVIISFHNTLYFSIINCTYCFWIHLPEKA